MRIVEATAGVVLLLLGQYCALNSLRIVILRIPTTSFGFTNPWLPVMTSLCGLGVAILGAILLLRAWADDRRHASRR